MTTEQRNIHMLVVKVSQLHQHWSSKLLATYPVTISISHMERSGAVKLGFRVKMNILCMSVELLSEFLSSHRIVNRLFLIICRRIFFESSLYRDVDL